jgi:hypothetical protein
MPVARHAIDSRMRRRSRRRPAAATANRDDDDGDDAAAPFVVRADGCCDTPFVVLGVPSTPTTGVGVAASPRALCLLAAVVPLQLLSSLFDIMSPPAAGRRRIPFGGE